MSKHYKVLSSCFPIILVFVVHFSFSQSKPPDDLTDGIQAIDAWLEAQRDYDHLPGISVGIVKDQQLIWSKGYGQSAVAENRTASPATIYSICSISKLFTSIAIMQLYEAGKLRLDDSVAALLPGFALKQQFKDSGPITIRGLLTHSSGIPRESEYPYWTGPEFPFPTRKEVDEKLGQQQTLYPAATYFQYSNLGMAILGEVVEKVSGKAFDAYVEENILRPLRLADTHPFLPEGEWGKRLAIGYGAIKRDGSRDQVKLFDGKGIKPAMGFSSTVEDLARFASWQFRLLNSGGKEILKASTLKEMQRVHWVDPDWRTNWGLGFSIFQIDGKTMVGHGGSCPGYRTQLLVEPKEKMAYVVMINSGDGDAMLVARQMRNLVLKASKEKISKSDSVSVYSGTYDSQPWGSETRILPWYGKLAIFNYPSHSPADEMTVLRHVKGDVFRRVRADETLAEEYVFEKDKNGKPVKMWHYSNFSTRVK